MRSIYLRITAFLFLFPAGFQSLAQPAIIPKPAKMEVLPGSFTLDNRTRFWIPGKDSSLLKVTCSFRTFLRNATGFEPGYARRQPGSGFIEVVKDPLVLSDEGYRLKVTPGRILISVRSAPGLFYAFQSLRQLLPPEIESEKIVKQRWSIPAVDIEDTPRFAYRGFMLDVARHFQPVEVLRKYVRLLSYYKINHFHLHLTDDQGWRIEIKKYPKLQEISAWRKESMVGHAGDKPRKYDGIRHGGYYTQEELRELVRYAADHFVTIIPEIELPGHSTAMLAAYPHLACFPRQFEVTPDYGVFDDVCCTKDSTFRFLEDVLSEVASVFPGSVIHIGGDECPKTRWKVCPQCQQRMKEEHLQNENELQSWFIRRIQQFLQKKGKNIIGWDEIMEGGAAPGSTLMYWRTWLGDKHIAEAARSGFRIIMSPLNPLYFNLYEDEERVITPLAYPGLIPLRKVYDYNPVPAALAGAEVKNILGVQANLWSEYVTDGSVAEYMTFPRACALAELAWTPNESKDYGDFIRRLTLNVRHLDFLHVRYSKYFLNK